MAPLAIVPQKGGQAKKVTDTRKLSYVGAGVAVAADVGAIVGAGVGVGVGVGVGAVVGAGGEE